MQESKDNTKRLLEEYKSTGKMTVGGSQIQANDANAIGALLAKVRAGDYVALTEYFGETIERDKAIAKIRETIARELHVATTTGYGPRFLHSTGQLHKGGADNGVFLQLTGGPKGDVPLPNEKFTFGVLVRAQAIGDFQSLVSRNRRVVSIALGEDVEGGLAEAGIDSEERSGEGVPSSEGRDSSREQGVLSPAETRSSHSGRSSHSALSTQDYCSGVPNRRSESWPRRNSE